MANSDGIVRNGPTETPVASKGRPGLKKIPPYWYPYRTNAKARWFDREILEVISTEFRDRSVEYYRYALQSGVTTINGKPARPGTIVRNGDTLENIVHRHEPPVTSTPVEILHHDKEREYIVINKPGSIPVHAAGRYFRNSLVEILKNDFGFPKVYTVNRLDRLTSGLMIIALSPERARSLTEEFTSGTMQKEYVARICGEFPAEEITCEEPLLTVDRQMGLNIVHPEGKDAKTVFTRMHYDKITDTSVVHCRPFTGRSHQIRVHLQYLGHPIANDAVYGDAKIWGSSIGKGGIDITPSTEREAPRPPPGLENSTAEGEGRVQITTNDTTNELVSKVLPADTEPSRNNQELAPSSRYATPAHMPGSIIRAKKRQDRKRNPAFRTKEESAALTANHKGEAPAPGALPRETGHDIGLGSPIPLSSEAVGVITRLRNQKDEDEDWGRWRDVVFRAKGALSPGVIELAHAEQHAPPSQAGKRKEATQSSVLDSSPDEECEILEPRSELLTPSPLDQELVDIPSHASQPVSSPTRTTFASARAPSTSQAQAQDKTATVSDSTSDTLFCPECYVPLHPDPKPDKLYIFLHAIRYTSPSLGSFETHLPEWAADESVWE